MSRTAGIRALVAKGETEQARADVARLLADLFAIEPVAVALNTDQYSLNSLNGFFEAGGEPFFFKFHQEEGEEAMSGEYYRVGLLARTGLPIDMPMHVSTEAGEQVLVYRRRSSPRFADVLRGFDEVGGGPERERALAAERALARQVGQVYCDSLHPITAEQSAGEAIHRLFFDRLVDPGTRAYPGGRLKGFYVGHTFRFLDFELPWDTLKDLKIEVNGVRYARTLGALFDEAHARLAPEALSGGGVIAHGDAHNANVWYERDGDRARLVLFDPAFAGEHVPALLADIKATFHNVLAHPFWLYEPTEARVRFQASAERTGDTLRIRTTWGLPPHREALLDIRAEQVWKPLLALLRTRGLLPDDWQRVMRLALFLCPTMVMNLRAGATVHNEVSSAIGFAAAMMCGSEPEQGDDLVSRFFARIAP